MAGFSISGVEPAGSDTGERVYPKTTQNSEHL
jgi:hypothetical protein